MQRREYQRIAAKIMVCFAEYRLSFQEITDYAQEYFERADWSSLQTLSAKRIDLYEAMVNEAASDLLKDLSDHIYLPSLWHDAKRSYAKLLMQRTDPELAETFYNSVYCRVFQHRHIDNEHMFIRSAMEGRLMYSGDQVYKSYLVDKIGLVSVISSLMDACDFGIPWENKRRDISNLVHYVRGNFPQEMLAAQGTCVDVVKGIFFRNKAAYVVGRVRNGDDNIPFVVPVLNNEAGAIYIDTALSDENDISIVFSFTRSYFLVDVNVPSEFVRFLNTLIPHKSIPELYSSIGFYKQGKAEFYRNFIDHLEQSSDPFIIAPGIKGMVMAVFTLASFPVVFKVIKDRFSSSKNVTPQIVKEKYQLVKKHDRVGRMADTQEFTNFSFPLSRFAPELLEELKKVAGSTIVIEGDYLHIKHLWIERYMTPLNIYIDDAVERGDEEALIHVIDEFGKSIKQLAAANIFAGDMLFKNFGVTRHGRVVFYDYDEIMYLTDCHFRKIPEAMYPEQELASEPWYSVAANDVFPEEFTLLTACNRAVRKIFNQLHSDLLDVSFWEEMQKKVVAGAVVDVFPYKKAQRFIRGD